MRMALAQLRGMMWYEFKMHWRSRGILAVLLVIMVIILLNMFNGSALFSQISELKNDSAQRRQIVTIALIRSSWGMIGMTLVLLLPVIVAETIPIDRQRHIRDLLDSLPLPYGIYLTGKLLGVWLVVLSGLVLVTLIVGAAWLLQFGAYDIRYYLETWLVGGGSIALMNAGLAVLLAAGQPTRRRAIVVVILTLVAAFLMRDFRASEFVNAAQPLRTAILNYYLNALTGRADYMIFAYLMPSLDTLRLAFLIGAAQVALVWVVVWAGQRWQGGKS